MIKLILILAGVMLLSCGREQAVVPPNILFISIDDLKPVLGCYGNQDIKSPNIDEIAERGMVFLNNHCQQALCGPSRASLLTGRYPDQIGVWGFYSIRERNPDVVTLPQHFRNKGYTTVNISKIFDYRTVDQGMDTVSWSWPYFPANRKDMLPFYPEESGPVVGYFYQSALVKEVFAEKFEEAGKDRAKAIGLTHKVIKPATECLDLDDDAYKDGVFAEKAIEDIKQLAAEGKPFFLGLGFERPHLPFTAPKRYWDLYDRDAIQTEPFQEMAENDKEYFYSLSNELRMYTDEQGGDAYGKLKDGIPLDEEEQKLLIHGYMAAVSYIDAQVGKVMEQLEVSGLADNTVVVVWGDHGWHLGDHGIWGKATNFEQATRSPLIISVPGLKVNSTMRPTEFTDLYPTLCELAGIDLPSGEEISGQSLVNLIRGEPDTENLYAFSQFTRGDRMGYAIRDERYRYVEWMNQGRHVNPGAVYSITDSDSVNDTQLFDYQTDPLETVNVSGMEEYAGIEAGLKKALYRWLENL